MERQKAIIEHHTWSERRRRQLRRAHSDRRTMIRYGPDKADRRQGFGRREEDQLWDPIRRRF